MIQNLAIGVAGIFIFAACCIGHVLAHAPASQMASPAANLKRRHCHWPNFESLCV